MNSITAGAGAGIAVRIPDHVVYRSFPRETVVLNLETGIYHSLNPTGGRMLEVLERTRDIEVAALRLATEYGKDLAEVRRDLLDLCDQMSEQQLIVIHDGRNGAG